MGGILTVFQGLSHASACVKASQRALMLIRDLESDDQPLAPEEVVKVRRAIAYLEKAIEITDGLSEKLKPLAEAARMVKEGARIAGEEDFGMDEDEDFGIDGEENFGVDGREC